MKITKKATNTEFNEALEFYLDKHLISHVERLVGEDDSVSLSIEVGKMSRHHHKGDVFRAEATLFVDGTTLRAEAERDDLHVAIDGTREELVRELTKLRKKRFSLIKRGGHKIKNFLKGFNADR